jgi:hypothetical protein
MTVGFMRWLQRNTIQAAGYSRYDWERCNRAAALQFALFRGELATTALQVEHQQMIIEPTYCARCRVRMR